MAVALRVRMKRKTRKSSKPVRSRDVPATAAMLFEMEERMNHRMDAGFHRMRAEFNGLRAEFGGLKAEVSGIKSELHRIALLVEEQNARNKYVLDGYAQLYELLSNRI